MDEQLVQLAKGPRQSVEEVIRDELLKHTPEEEAERDRLCQDFMYTVDRPLLQQTAHDPKLHAQALKLATVTPEQQAAAAAQADAMSEAVLMPLAKKLLQLQGLDPENADPDAVRAALSAPLNDEQAQQLAQEYESINNILVQPMVTELLREAGVEVDSDNSEEVWQLAEKKLKEWDGQPAAAHPAVVAIPAALFGSLVTLAVVGVIKWVRRRRQRRQQQLEDIEEGEEEEVLLEA